MKRPISSTHLPSVEPDEALKETLHQDFDGRLREALGPPEETVQRLLRRALEEPEAPRRTWPWATAATATAAACLVLLVLTQTSTKPTSINSTVLAEASNHSVTQQAPVEETIASLDGPSPVPPKRTHLRLSNDGDTLQLTAPSGSTLIILRTDQLSRR